MVRPIPSGRLPVTFPKSLEDLPPFEDYNMAGRTYRYMEKEPLFPFGFGLSYSTFSYSDLKLSSNRIKKGQSLTATFTIQNTDAFTGEEVVQLYLKNLDSKHVVPLYSLKQFERISLKPGERKQMQFEINTKMLETITDDGTAVVELGKYQLFIGGALPSERSVELGAVEALSVEFELR